MKLIITQPEIESIVRAHVQNTVQFSEGSEMKIDFTATRSEDGITATIDIPYMGVSGIAELQPAPVKPAAPKRAVKAAPAPIAPQAVDVQEAAQEAGDASPEETGTDAAAEGQDEAQAASGDATAPVSNSRGPSLFGSGAAFMR